MQGGEQVASVVLVRSPVEIGPPVGRETVIRVRILGLVREAFGGLLGQPEQGGHLAVLPPTVETAFGTGVVGVDSDLCVGRGEIA